VEVVVIASICTDKLRHHPQNLSKYDVATEPLGKEIICETPTF